MVQLGWNAGPRHARVWGLAKSFNRKIDKATMTGRDEDAIALMTLCWSLAKASIPGEVMDVLEDSLKESGMPRIATRNVPEGKIHNLYCQHLVTYKIRDWILPRVRGDDIFISQF